MPTSEALRAMANILVKQADDMAKAGHNGWPNGNRFAAEMFRQIADGMDPPKRDISLKQAIEELAPFFTKGEHVVLTIEGEQLADINRFLADQTPLDADMAKVWDDNVERLYEK